ncbi:uncharacterized protein LOC110092728 [Dendrobium catenatum]|uniref:uncharacterized protein LOC110092728 n=1 Tax=Dendrobium catenatum TaxID=906689 RepID=UPI0009F69556|nr:uncharacterized protein LOC110092728 [Dendrobium catenatum]
MRLRSRFWKISGFYGNHRGIEANPKKIKALRDMVPPKNVKEVQRLNGRIAGLSHFLACSGDKYLPFFKVLRGACSSDFQWTDECQEAFEQLRKYLASPSLLSKLTPREKLYLYIAVSPKAISSVLVHEDNTVQRPIYYVNKILSEMEGRYPLADKTALALVYSARKLRPYFQTHSIGVYTNVSLKTILQKSKASGRLVKWSIELGEFDIHYLPRPDIKSQALADFVVECTVPETTLEYGLRLKFPAINNMTEYEAFIAGLRLEDDCEVHNLVVHTDSQLVASQVEGEFDINNLQLAQYYKFVKLLLARIGEYQIVHVLRKQNARVDALSKLATLTTGDIYKRKCVEEIHFPSIQGPWVIQSINEIREESWINLILSFLQDVVLPEELMAATRLRRRAANFTIIGGELYKRAFTGPYLKCLPPSEADYALREVCGEHLAGRALAYKIMR